jgi:hypothetical protein
LVVMVVMSSSYEIFGQGTNKVDVPVSEAEVKEVLLKAWDLYYNQPEPPLSDSPKFLALLTKVRSAMPQVDVATEFGKARFAKFTLNKLGTMVNGLRFKTPQGAKRSLVLGFACPKALREEQKIVVTVMPTRNLPVMDADIPGFETTHNPACESTPWPNDYACTINKGYEGPLEPDKEYFIRVVFLNEDRPVDVYVAIYMVDNWDKVKPNKGTYRSGRARDLETWEQLVLSVGLKPGNPVVKDGEPEVKDGKPEVKGGKK